MYDLLAVRNSLPFPFNELGSVVAASLGGVSVLVSEEVPDAFRLELGPLPLPVPVVSVEVSELEGLVVVSGLVLSGDVVVVPLSELVSEVVESRPVLVSELVVLSLFESVPGMTVVLSGLAPVVAVPLSELVLVSEGVVALSELVSEAVVLSELLSEGGDWPLPDVVPASVVAPLVALASVWEVVADDPGWVPLELSLPEVVPAEEAEAEAAAVALVSDAPALDDAFEAAAAAAAAASAGSGRARGQGRAAMMTTRIKCHYQATIINGASATVAFAKLVQKICPSSTARLLTGLYRRFFYYYLFELQCVCSHSMSRKGFIKDFKFQAFRKGVEYVKRTL